MENKEDIEFKGIVNELFGTYSIKGDLDSYNVPFEYASDVKIFSDKELFPICDISSKIPIHL